MHGQWGRAPLLIGLHVTSYLSHDASPKSASTVLQVTKHTLQKHAAGVQPILASTKQKTEATWVLEALQA